MATVMPRSWTSAETVTAKMINDDVRDNAEAVGADEPPLAATGLAYRLLSRRRFQDSTEYLYDVTMRFVLTEAEIRNAQVRGDGLAFSALLVEIRRARRLWMGQYGIAVEPRNTIEQRLDPSRSVQLFDVSMYVRGTYTGIASWWSAVRVDESPAQLAEGPIVLDTNSSDLRITVPGPSNAAYDYGGNSALRWMITQKMPPAGPSPYDTVEIPAQQDRRARKIDLD